MPPTIRVLSNIEVRARARDLAALLLDAVDDGASVGFLSSVTPTEAQRYWEAAADPDKGNHVIVAQEGLSIVGVVIVAPILNTIQPHRSEVFKMVVHRSARGLGLGKQLLKAAEVEAHRMNRPVMTLLTRNGSVAERMYSNLGWCKIGVLPEDSVKPDGALCDAAIFHKRVVAPLEGAA